MFTIETPVFSLDLLFSTLYFKNKKLVLAFLMLSQALQTYLLLEICDCLEN